MSYTRTITKFENIGHLTDDYGYPILDGNMNPVNAYVWYTGCIVDEGTVSEVIPGWCTARMGFITDSYGYFNNSTIGRWFAVPITTPWRDLFDQYLAGTISDGTVDPGDDNKALFDEMLLNSVQATSIAS